VSEWREVALGEVLTLQRGFDLPARAREDGPVPVVSSAGVTGHHSVAKVDPPGVVIGRYGSLGSVHWIEEPFWPLNTALWVKDFKGNDPRFVSYLLKTINTDSGSAAAVPGVNRDHLHRLRVRIPARCAQRRIAAVLSAVDRLIACNDERIRCLERLGAVIYREWFERERSREAGRLEPATKVFDLNPRIAPAHVPIAEVTMADVNEASSWVFPSAQSERCTGSRFQRDDVLLARITPCLENGKTALVKFLAPGETAVGSTELIVMRGRSVGPAFTYYCARSERLRSHAIKGMSGSSGRQRVSVDSFASLQIYEPSPEMARRFERVAGPMLEHVYVLAAQNRRLAAARNLLLPRLIGGRLDVSDVDLGALTPDEAAT
jgi:type I restriction enzyme S subunit